MLRAQRVSKEATAEAEAFRVEKEHEVLLFVVVVVAATGKFSPSACVSVFVAYRVRLAFMHTESPLCDRTQWLL